MSGYKLTLRGDPRAAREYACPEHGPFELVVDLATSRDPRPCPVCGAASDRTIEANIVARVDPLSWIRGKSEKPDHPMAPQTELLAEGMPMKEYRAMRRKKWRAWDYKRAKDKGLIPTKAISVGKGAD